MKRIKARVAIEETIRVMMEKGADDEAIEKATLAIDAKTKVGVFERQIWNQRFVQAKENVRKFKKFQAFLLGLPQDGEFKALICRMLFM